MRVTGERQDRLTADERFAVLFREELPRIVGSVYLVLGDVEAARDVAQEAFARTYVKWSRVGAYERPGAFVRRVAIRLAIRSRGRAVRRRRADAAAALVAVTAPPEVVDGELRDALSVLSPMQRAAVVLRYFDDLPVREVAEALGCAEATANVHLHRARRRLAEILGEDE